MFGQGLNFGGLTGASGPFDADFLVVAGGGGGGGYNNAGGGGGGGLRTSYPGGSGGGQSSETSLSLSVATPYDVEVGLGGAGGTNSGSGTSGVAGTNSEFNGIISDGGGYGGKYDATGGTGGSGGGGGYQNQAGGAAVTSPAIQGYAGQAGVSAAPGYIGGAGGGAGEVGGTDGQGHGGDGLQVNIDGLNNFYAGGGSGGANDQSIPGSSGGGGNGGYADTTNPGNGTPNTGGGGGGASGGTANTGGNGGKGTVILRYPTADVSSYAVTGTLDTVADTAYPVANTAYYKLNGGSGTTVTDSSGNGYNGTASNITYAAGRFGNAAVFNGTNAVITTSAIPITNTTSFSVSSWVYISSLSIGYIIPFCQTTLSVANGFIFFAIRPLSNLVEVVRTDSGGAGLSNTASHTWSLGWHHVAWVCTNTNSKIYVNDSEIDDVNYTQTSALSYNLQTIGARLRTVQMYYGGGTIDQVRIFSTALTAGNVTSLYNESTVNESTDGTDSILQFIGGSGDITFS